MHGLGRRPSANIRIEADPIGFVDTLHEEYVACGKAYREERRDLLQNCGFLAVKFREKKIFEKLSCHPCWEDSRQKPKRNGRSKWAVYMMLQPKNKESRKIASKYGRALDFLFAEGIEPKNFADTIRDWGGIGATAAMHSGKKEAAAKSKRALKTSGRSKLEDDDFDSNKEEDIEDPKNGVSPGMKRSSFPEDDVIRGETFSRKMKDNLFVECSKRLMAEALKPGKILIAAEVSKIEGKAGFFVKATNIERLVD